MKLRLARPGKLIDIGRLAELKGVRSLPDGRVAVGALTTYAELLDSPVSGGPGGASIAPGSESSAARTCSSKRLRPIRTSVVTARVP